MQTDYRHFTPDIEAAKTRIAHILAEIETLDADTRIFILASLIGEHVAKAGSTEQQNIETVQAIDTICSCIRRARRKVAAGLIASTNTQTH